MAITPAMPRNTTGGMLRPCTGFSERNFQPPLLAEVSRSWGTFWLDQPSGRCCLGRRRGGRSSGIMVPWLARSELL